jgi:hypothetical protein
VCGLRSGAAVRKDAELVPLWVGKYDPALIALADVGASDRLCFDCAQARWPTVARCERTVRPCELGGNHVPHQTRSV